MPYQQVWVAPELFLSHSGVNVYRVYSDDDIDQGPKSYWFTTKPMESGEDCDPFDVRDLKVPSRALLDGQVALTCSFMGGAPKKFHSSPTNIFQHRLQMIHPRIAGCPQCSHFISNCCSRYPATMSYHR